MTCILGQTSGNHTSAIQFSEHVTQHITKELKFRALLVPFKERPCNLHISIFMTREKSNSQVRRTITDLS